MQRHPSMFRRGLLIWSLTVVATPVSAARAQGEPPSPWTAERANALVRIEAPGNRPAPDVATGFIVNGHGGKQYVATVTHGLLPTATQTQRGAFQPDDCELLPDGTKLFQGNRGGPELRPNCAHHLGKDVSLVELYSGTSPLPALPFLACGLVAGDDVHLGGFALGNDRILMVGKVRGNAPQGMIIADALTAGGLSGGPYLTAAGDVVAIHQGLAENTAGYAQVVPVSAVRTKLEVVLPQMKTSDACPKPISDEQLIKKQLDDLVHKYLGLELTVDPKATLEERIHGVEEYITVIRNEVQWGLTLDNDRQDVGPVLTIWYHRLVAANWEEESPPPPATEMQLTVLPLPNPIVPLTHPDELVYSEPHTWETAGKSGKYEAFLRSTLRELAKKNGITFQRVQVDLRYTDKPEVVTSSRFSLKEVATP